MKVFDFKSWTVVGVLTWFLVAVLGGLALLAANALLEGNIRDVADRYGLNTLLRKALSATPSVLFHRETWFASGLVVGAIAMVWFVWAFPHRLGESTAHESFLKKWGAAVPIIIFVCGALAYLHYGPQPVLPTSMVDIENAVEPFRETLVATNKLLKDARDENNTRKVSREDVDVILPTYLRLQFAKDSYNDAPQEIGKANTHWTYRFASEHVAKYCIDKVLFCQLQDPNGFDARTVSPRYSRTDLEQRFAYITLVFGQPIKYRTIKIDLFGVGLNTDIESQQDRFAIIRIALDPTITTFTVLATAVP